MPSIKTIEARLDVANVVQSAALYADVLGFDIRTLWPEDSPQVAILNRDGQRLQLSRREGTSVPVSHPPVPFCRIFRTGLFPPRINPSIERPSPSYGLRWP